MLMMPYRMLFATYGAIESLQVQRKLVSDFMSLLEMFVLTNLSESGISYQSLNVKRRVMITSSMKLKELGLDY